MTLYELIEEAQMGEQELEKWAAEHDGDITECPMVDIMEKIEGDIKTKLLGWGVWYKNLMAESDALKAEIVKLTQRKKVLDNKAGRIQATISHFLTEKELKNENVVIKRTRSTSVFVSDINYLDDRFLRKVTKEEPDKKKIKDALKVGAKVNGACIKENENVSIK